MSEVQWKSITNQEILNAYEEKRKAEENFHETLTRVRSNCKHEEKLKQIWVGSMYAGDFCIDCGSVYGETTRGFLSYAEV